MLAAPEADDERPRAAAVPPTPAERAEAARLYAAERLRDSFVCRCCVLRLVARLVVQAVEDAERDLRERVREQMQWPN